MLLSIVTVTVTAINPIGFDVTVSSSEVKPGEQVELIISLTGYSADVDAIRGLQVDITGVEPGVLDPVTYTSLIEDSTAVSNTASYNEAHQRVRLAYVQMSETLPAPCEDVFKVVFQVSPDLSEIGSITLPVTVKIQTTSQQITLTDECTISYAPGADTVTSVDITWGSMEFEYSDGIWNPQTYTYDGTGWTDNGTGFVTVKNTGTSTATTKFSYDTVRSDITGSFTNEATPIIGSVDIVSGTEATVRLVLSGKPSEALRNTQIGTVTVTIGGK